MKRIEDRTDTLFSMCGLNCGLCPMQVRGECGGCLSGTLCYKSCGIVHCERRLGSMQYCFECGCYPCEKYDGIDLFDSLITHKNQKKDLEKAKRMGIDAYLDEQREKVRLLGILLENYDDGRKDVFYCTAVNMLETEDIEEVIEEAGKSTAGMDIREKAKYMKTSLDAKGVQKGITLRLRR